MAARHVEIIGILFVLMGVAVDIMTLRLMAMLAHDLLR